MVVDPMVKKEVINMLLYNLKDDTNSYIMKEDGTYEEKKSASKSGFNVHKEFFNVTKEEILKAELFD
jgi:polyphosphate kinase